MAKRPKDNDANRLEDALAHLIRSQAASAQQWTAFVGRLAETEQELAIGPRENAERFARVEAILLRHEKILQCLPEVIRERIGSRPAN